MRLHSWKQTISGPSSGSRASEVADAAQVVVLVAVAMLELRGGDVDIAHGGRLRRGRLPASTVGHSSEKVNVGADERQVGMLVNALPLSRGEEGSRHRPIADLHDPVVDL